MLLSMLMFCIIIFKYYNFKQGGYTYVLKYKDILILIH